jgi:hypothetical protein
MVQIHMSIMVVSATTLCSLVPWYKREYGGNVFVINISNQVPDYMVS